MVLSCGERDKSERKSELEGWTLFFRTLGAIKCFRRKCTVFNPCFRKNKFGQKSKMDGREYLLFKTEEIENG